MADKKSVDVKIWTAEDSRDKVMKQINSRPHIQKIMKKIISASKRGEWRVQVSRWNEILAEEELFFRHLGYEIKGKTDGVALLCWLPPTEPR